MLRKLRKAKKRAPSKRKNKPIDTEIMISNINKLYFRIVMFLFFTLAVVFSGYAPNKGPKLPDGFCKYGDVTATTGECMCHWQHKVRFINDSVLSSSPIRRVVFLKSFFFSPPPHTHTLSLSLLGRLYWPRL